MLNASASSNLDIAERESGQRQRNDAAWTGLIEAQYRDSLRQYQSVQGRVERVHHKLQDRLVKELRLVGIKTVNAADAFLPGFITHYNARFDKAPARDKDLHRVIDQAIRQMHGTVRS